MRDDGGGSLEELELWGVADDDGISWQGSEAGWIESAAEGEDELNVEAGAGFGDCFENLLGAVLESAEGGVDERATVEAIPGKWNGWPLLVIDEGAGVVKVRWRLLAVANSSAWGNCVIWANGESASVEWVRGLRFQVLRCWLTTA